MIWLASARVRSSSARIPVSAARARVASSGPAAPGPRLLRGLVMLACGQGDPLVGVLPGRFHLGQVPGAKARGDRAVRDDPGPETGQGRPGGQRQPQQPQRQARDRGQRGQAVIGQRLALVRARASTQARTTPISVSDATA